ncbi:acyl-CoA dehydrogenase [Roseibium aquae]|nr:acyl-CoA dehydrogenase [Roseibium aquae]
MSEDRRMIADSLNRFLGDTYGIEHRTKVAYDAPFHDPEKWTQLADLGVLYALAGEGQGGYGGTGFDIMAVFEPLGRALCPEPVLPALMAARVLAAGDETANGAGTGTGTGAGIGPLLSGAVRYGVAIGEIEAPYGLEDIAAQAEAVDGGYRVSGRKSVVYGGHVADLFLVAARLGDTLAVFEVAARDCAVSGYGLIDGGGATEVFLDDAPARLVVADGAAALQDALDAGALALCAEALGVMDRAFALLLEYLKTRKQFGQTIGSFQALQHRTVDLATEIEQARSITILAASRMGTPDQSRTVSMAKNLIGRTARLIAEESIQMQGGIAMTWEYPSSHLAKRLVMIDHQLGDTDFHLERVMAAHQAA